MPNDGNDSIRLKGSVLDQLGLEPAAVLELKLKAQLHEGILKLIKQQNVKRRDLEKIWDVPQPRVSEFMRGKLSTLSVAKLLFYARKLGAYADVKLRVPKAA